MKKCMLFLLLLCSINTIQAQSFSQTFTTTGFFVVPAGVTSITVQLVGAGGKGDVNGGGGGGGGGYASSQYTVTPGDTLPFTVGIPGGGPNSTSTFSLMIATGGTNATGNSGGAGGTGSGGNLLNHTGGNGGNGMPAYFGAGGGGAGGPQGNGGAGGNSIIFFGVCQYPGGTPGASGGAPGGNGGKGAGYKDTGCSVTDTAGVGFDYGGGGGGGNGIGSTPGTGATGCCVISWTGCVTPSMPVNTTPTANLYICGMGNTTVSASGAGTLTWYTTPTGNNSTVYTGNVFVTPTINATGTYYVEASTCTVSVSRTPVTITVTPMPTVTPVYSPVISCQKQQVTLLVSGASTYSWSTGATTPSIIITPSTTTSYTVTGTNTGNCNNKLVITQTVMNCTGIDDYSREENDLKVYPNPNTGEFRVKGGSGQELQLINELGQQLSQLVLDSNGEGYWQLNDLPPGLYFISGPTGSYKSWKKVLITH